MPDPKKRKLDIQKHLLRLRETAPRDSKQSKQAKANFLSQVEALGTPILKSEERKASWFTRLPILRAPVRAFVTLFLAIVLVASSTGFVVASQNSLPADPLYPLKIALEDFQLAFSLREEDDARLLLRFIERRLSEANSLVGEGRYDDLSIPMAYYDDELFELGDIISGLADDDPSSNLLLSLLIQSLTENERLLAMLQSELPDSVSDDVESSVHISSNLADSPDFADLDIETEVEFYGALEAISAQALQICGIEFSVDRNIKIEGLPKIGDLVRVDFVDVDNFHVATKLEENEPGAICELQLEGILDLRGDTSALLPWQLAGVNFFATTTTELISDPKAGDFIHASAIVAPDGSFQATYIEAGPVEYEGHEEDEEDEYPTLDLTPSNTPQPATTGSATETPHPTEESESPDETEDSSESPHETEEPDEEDDYEEIRFVGIVQSKSSGSWQIDGKTVEITANSEVDDGINLGDEVDVRAWKYSDGTLEAERIELND